MSMLDRLIPKPALREIDRAELAVNADRAWRAIRELDLARSLLVRTLFAIRTIPDRLQGKTPPLRLRLDDMISTPDKPGFQILAEDPPREVAVGAIGKVWRLVIPFVHVPDADAFAAFSKEDHLKVAWALRTIPESESASRIEFELRVAATDDAAWRKFVRYFRLIGPGSHLIRRVLLAQLERDLGTPDSQQKGRVFGTQFASEAALSASNHATRAPLPYAAPATSTPSSSISNPAVIQRSTVTNDRNDPTANKAPKVTSRERPNRKSEGAPNV
jgi:hypothetical protein